MSNELRALLGELLELHFWRLDHANKRIAEQIWVIALVEAPFELIQVGIQMLPAYLMIRADDRPLEKRPHAFHAVCVNVAAHPLFASVIDCLMFSVLVCDSFVSGALIGENTLSGWIG